MDVCGLVLLGWLEGREQEREIAGEKRDLVNERMKGFKP